MTSSSCSQSLEDPTFMIECLDDVWGQGTNLGHAGTIICCKITCRVILSTCPFTPLIFVEEKGSNFGKSRMGTFIFVLKISLICRC